MIEQEIFIAEKDSTNKKKVQKLSMLVKFLKNHEKLTFNLYSGDTVFTLPMNSLLDFIVGYNSSIEYSFLFDIINSLPYDTPLGFLTRAFAPILWKFYLFHNPIKPAIYELTSFIEQLNSNPTMEFQKFIFKLTLPKGSVKYYDLNNFANFINLTSDIFYSTMPGNYKALEEILSKLQVVQKTEKKPLVLFAASLLAYLGYILCIDKDISVLIFSDETLRKNPFKKIIIQNGKFLL